MPDDANNIKVYYNSNATNPDIDSIMVWLKMYKLINYISNVINSNDDTPLSPTVMWLLAEGLHKYHTNHNLGLAHTYVSDIQACKLVSDIELKSLKRLEFFNIVKGNDDNFTRFGRNVLKSLLPDYDKYLTLNHLFNIFLVKIPLIIMSIISFIVTVFLIFKTGDASAFDFVSVLLVIGWSVSLIVTAGLASFVIDSPRINFECPRSICHVSKKDFLVCWLSNIGNQPIFVDVNPFINNLEYGLFPKKSLSFWSQFHLA